MIVSSSSILTAIAQKIKARNQNRNEQGNLSERPEAGTKYSSSPKKIAIPANTEKADKTYDTKPVISITKNPIMFSWPSPSNKMYCKLMIFSNHSD